MSVLGAMMLKEQAAEEVATLLQDEDFYIPAHREIYRAMRDLAHQAKQVDLVTIKNQLQAKGKLVEVGGEDYLIQIAEFVPSASAATHYASIVAEKAMLRRLDTAGHDIVKIVRNTEMEPDDKLDRAEQAVFGVRNSLQSSDFIQLQSLATEFVADMDTLVETGEPIEGVKTDFYDLDRMTTGFYPGDLVIVAARPSMGKTSLVLNMAVNVARRTKQSVALFSLEMSGKQLARRIASMLSGVRSDALSKAGLKSDDYRRLSEACEVMYDLPIHIDESSDISGLDMRQKCRRLKRQGGLALVVVDYLQLMKSSKNRTENRVQEISEIARSLKQLAKELDVPVVALSQLSRRVEERENKRPQLSDLRDSGSIEAEADIVMFIYREAYYKDREAPDEADRGVDRVEVAEIIVQKHRNGPTGTVKLGFQPTYANFVNLKL